VGEDDFLESTVEITVARSAEGQLRVADDPRRALLVVLSGGRIGQRVVLGEEPVVIGRGSGCSLMLQGDSISRQHARVEWTDGGHVLADLRSTNGSFVNYERITNRLLRDGDQVQIGKTLLKYLAGNNPEARYHEDLDRLVRHDPLTGALNKSAFDEEFHLACGAAGLVELCLIVFDLDHFKAVNDNHGHTAGDMVLRGVGEAVRLLVREPFCLGRVGGEEFAVVAPGAGLREVSALAERIRAQVQQQRFVFDDVTIPVTLSLGVCQLKAGEEPEALYERADRQLYAAKKGGRNRVSAG
jgi:diguanylate cyclase (GGDEF)-like protein